MATETKIHLETGELREGLSASARLFFVYVTPTGAEIPLTRCPHISKIYGRTDGGFEGTSRLTTFEYKVKHQCTLKMINIHSTFGRPNTVAHIFLNVDPAGPSIVVKGVDGFGKFSGRAHIDLKRSTVFRQREKMALDRKTLSDVFGFKTIQVGKTSSKPRRSLIF